MAFPEKTPKSEKIESSPFIHYYPHSSMERRKRQEDYLMIASIDPAIKNLALRIEQRYDNGKVFTLVFDKVSIQESITENNTVVCLTYNNLTKFLDQYKEYFQKCHFILIERQLAVNYKSTRVAQHTISYLSLAVKDNEFLTDIIEISPTIKGKMLPGGTKLTKTQLKKWAVDTARELLEKRGDEWCLSVMDGCKNKQDDLADTVCQIEGAILFWKKNGGPCAYLL